MTLKFALTAAVAATALAACTPTYVAPKTGPFATVSLSRAGLTDAEHAKLMVTDREGKGRADIYGKLLFTYDEPARIPASAPLVMEVQILRYAGQMEHYCGHRFSFLPTESHSYEVTPNDPLIGDCTATVIDTETGRPAPNLQIIPIGPGWRPAD